MSDQREPETLEEWKDSYFRMLKRAQKAEAELAEWIRKHDEIRIAWAAVRDQLADYKRYFADAEKQIERMGADLDKAVADRNRLLAERKKYPHIDKALEIEGKYVKLREALWDLLNTWELAEANRGVYSCCQYHDCRCSALYNPPQECVCGREDLEGAAKRARNALAGQGQAD